MQSKHIIFIAVGVLAFLVLGAGAAAMIKSNEAGKTAVTSSGAERVEWNQSRNAPSQPVCDDDNIVGKVAGGVIGGVAGSQVGSGSGKTAATIGGSVGGTLLGEEYIPTHNTTCP